MTTTRIPGLEYDEQALAELCQRWHIRELRLFGSRARGDARPDSDVDLMAVFESGKTPGFAFVDLVDELHGVFDLDVDLITNLPPRNESHRASIERDLTRLYAA
jgi:uncharacterized protein